MQNKNIKLRIRIIIIVSVIVFIKGELVMSTTRYIVKKRTFKNNSLGLLKKVFTAATIIKILNFLVKLIISKSVKK